MGGSQEKEKSFGLLQCGVNHRNDFIGNVSIPVRTGTARLVREGRKCFDAWAVCAPF